MDLLAFTSEERGVDGNDKKSAQAFPFAGTMMTDES